MSENGSQEHRVILGKDFLHRHRKIFWGCGAFAVLLFAAGGFLWKTVFSPRPAPRPAPQTALIGMIDLQQAIRSHGDYEKLQVLQQECQLLKEEARDALPVMEKQPPEVDRKPFDDSVWQKNAQNIIGQRAEIERQRKKAAAAYREESQKSYEARRDEINDAYLNAILNLQLKIQNADILHLSPETVAELQGQLDALKQERGMNHYRLYRQWEQEIEDYANAAVAPSLEALRTQMYATKAELEADAIRKHAEAQNRDIQALEEKMKESRERQLKLAEKQEELAGKQQERDALEARIFNDIAGRAAKLAILHHFTMVLANPATNPEALIPWESWQGARPVSFQSVISLDTVDITDELIQELRSMF